MNKLLATSFAATVLLALSGQAYASCEDIKAGAQCDGTGTGTVCTVGQFTSEPIQCDPDGINNQYEDGAYYQAALADGMSPQEAKECAAEVADEQNVCGDNCDVNGDGIDSGVNRIFVSSKNGDSLTMYLSSLDGIACAEANTGGGVPGPDGTTVTVVTPAAAAAFGSRSASGSTGSAGSVGSAGGAGATGGATTSPPAQSTFASPPSARGFFGAERD